jgi:hypothetical protein
LPISINVSVGRPLFLMSSLESANLHNKYAVTAKEILAERDEQAQQLNQFLVELGYE